MSGNEDSKRIAKNSIILYIRMMFQMIVFLYTVRLVLKLLGKEDYGIYDVAGGLVTIMIFLNNSLTTCTQRYITYALGTKDKEYLCKTYSMSINIHFLLALIIIVVGESLGMWYVLNFLNIPQSKLFDAIIVYQCSLLAGVLLIMSVPYNSCIIAHEKMASFATISIIDIILKFAAAVSLNFIPQENRLISYGVMMASASIIIRVTYGIYCKYAFKDIKYRWNLDKSLFHEMLKFTGWSTFGNFAIVCNNQGLSLILNHIGGPALNAARAVAFQVQTAVIQFISSFQTAINPNITKSYAQGNKKYLNELVSRSSRLSFLFVLIMIIPLITEANNILSLWLVNPPNYSVTFMRLLLCITLIDATANPMMIAASATGNIKKYHVCIGTTLLTVIPISLTTLYFFRNHPEYIYVILLIITFFAHIIRMRICKDLFDFDIIEFISQSFWKMVICGGLSFSLPLILHYKLSKGIFTTIIICLVSIIWTLLCIYLTGLKKDERTFIKNKIRK